MAVLGTVIAINGTTDAVNHVIVVNERGEKRVLHLNDSLQSGETIITPPGVIVELQLANGKVMDIFAEQTVKFTPEFADAVPASSGDSSVDQATIQAVIKAIDEGRDIGDVLEETAAGIDGGGGVTDYGFNAYDLARVVEVLGASLPQTDIGSANLFRFDPGIQDADTSIINGTGSVSTVVSGTPAAPQIPDLTASSDSGISNIDNITNFTKPSFSVSVPTGFTATLYIDGVVTPSTLTGGLLIPTGTLVDGPHSVTYTVTDGSGQTSAQSPNLSIVIDTAAPTAGSIVETDNVPGITGTITNLSTINDPKPVISGSGAEVGATITVVVGGQTMTTTVGAGGTWNVTPPIALTNGQTYTPVITATDAAGNTSAPVNGNTFTIDTAAPTAGSIVETDNVPGITGTITNLSTINDPKPVISGSGAEVGATITVVVGGQTMTTTVGAGGTWNVTPPIALTNGQTYTPVITATDAAGNTSAPVNGNTFTIDTVAPIVIIAPDMTAATDTGISNTDDITGNNKPDFAIPVPGTGETPSLYVDGVKVSSTFNALTNTLTPSSPLSNASHTITYTLTDLAGNESTQSPSLPIVVNAVVPATPAIAPDMTAATDTGVSNTDDVTQNNTPDFAISAPGAGLTPHLYINGVEVPAIFNSTSNTLTPVNPLPDGTYTVAYTVSNVSGSESPLSPTLNNVVIDTAAPTAGSIVETDNVPGITGTITNLSTINDPKPVISGSGAEVGATITVVVGGQTMTTTVGAGGTWNVTPPIALTNGQTYTPVITATDAAGNTSAPVNGNTFTIDTAAPTAGSIVETDNVPGITGTITNLSTINDPKPVISGSGAEVGATITVVVGGQTMTTTVGAGGTWNVTPPIALTNGQTYTPVITATDAAGNTSAPVNGNTFTIDTAAPTAGSIVETDNVPGITGTITNLSTINDPKPVISGSGAEVGATITVVVGGQTMTTTVGAGGTWNVTPPIALTNGQTYTPVITATDAAGNTSAPVNGNTFTIDTAAPTAGSIVETDNVPGITGTITNLSTINDPKPVISGSGAEVGATITVVVGGQTMTTTVGAGGTWNVTPPIALTNGQTYTPVITATDAAGNTSAPVNGNTFTIDTAAPTAGSIVETDNVPGITGTITNLSTINDPKPVISGSGAEVGATITVVVGGQTMTTTVGAGGTWNVTPPIALTNGQTYTPVITATDAAGNTSAPVNGNTFTIDTAAPTAGSIVETDNVPGITGTITNLSTINDPKPVISGSGAEVGATITVVVGGQTMTTTVGAGGTWNVTPPIALTNGQTYTPVITATDAAGNTSAPVNGNTFTIDTAAPTAGSIVETDNVPGITGTITNLSTINDPKPVISGSGAEVGATITVVVGGQTMTTTVGAGGTWNVTPPIALTNGQTYTPVITATDAAGNTSAPVNGNTFTIDTAAPTAGSIVETDNVPGITGTITNLSTINDPKPVISGSGAEVGATITVVVGGQTMTTTVGAGGTWNVTPPIALTNGQTYTPVITATDAAGNTSAPVNGNTFTIDTAAPTAGSIVETDNVPGITGTITNLSTINDPKPVISGSGAEVGATITVVVGGQTMTTTVGAGGTWNVTPPIALTNGQTYTPVITATDAAGNTSAPVNGNTFTIDTAAPTAGSIVETDNVPGITGTITNLSTINDPKPVISGSGAEVGATITVVVGGQTMTTTVGAGGTWNVTPPIALTNGQTYTPVITATDAAGNTSAPVNGNTFTIDTAAPTAGSIVETDNVPGITGTITNLSTINDPKPVISGSGAEVGATITVVVGGQTMTTTVGAGGTWNVTPPIALTNGQTYTPVITATDAAGNTSAPVNGNTFTIDTAAPTAGSIVETDNVPGITGTITNLSTINDPKPVISGSGAEVGATITVVVGGQTMTTTVGAGGTWNVTPPIALTNGQTYTPVITATDAAGNTSAPVNGNTFTIDTAAPTAGSIVETDNVPGITGTITNLSTINDPKPVISGSGAEVGATITVVVGGQTMTTTVGAGGTWNVTPPIALTNGQTYTPVITATDAAGNTSAPVNGNTFTIDTAAPTAGSIVETDNVPGITGTITNLSTINDPKPVISGSGAEVGATITVVVGGQTMTTTVGAGGTWNVTPPIALTNGQTYTPVITATDAAGNTSAPVNGNTFTIDTAAPTAGSIVETDNVPGITGTITNLSTINDPKPVISGSGAEVGATITVVVGGQTMTTTVGAGGTWNVTPPIALTNGQTYTPVITATDAAGNTSAPVNGNTFTIDTAAPTAGSIVETDNVPGITGTITNLSTINDPKPVISGSGAEVGATITVVVGGQTMTTTVGAGGTWNVTPPIALTNGQTYTPVITATDAAGNTSAPVNGNTFTIDTAAPTAGSIVETDNVPGITGTITNLSTINDPKPVISGSGAEVGATITVVVGGQTMTTTVGAGGTWNVTPPIALTNGQTYTPVITATDAAGNTSAPVNGNTFTIDTAAPTAGSIVETDNVPGITGTITNLSTINDPKPVISGSGAEVGATITVVVGGQTMTTTVGAGGTWNVTPPIALTNGQTYTPVITATDAAGNTSAPVNGNTFTIDTAAPTAGSIVETDNVPGITGTITNLSTINDPKPVISGSGAEVGATITVVVGGQTMTTTVGAGGTWNVTPPIALTNGQTYTPVITATDAAGNTSAPVNGNTFTIDTAAPTAGSIVETDNVPGITGTITNLSTINDPKPVISGSGAEVGATITVVVGGQTMTTTVGAGGTWNVTPPIALTNGQTYTPVITATDAAGNTSAPVNGNTFTIDTAAPTAGSIVETDNVPGITGTITNLSTINDPKPVISGSGAEVGATITVVVGGQTMTTTVGAGGTWNVTPPIALTNGQTYTPVITATDAAGNTSAPVNGNTFTIDTAAPTAGSIVETDNVPGITGTITNLSTINDPKPVISGSGAEVGATITVVVGGQTMTTTVGAGGTWNVTPPIALTNGQTYTPVITATDAAGNTSAPVNGNTFTIDTAAPTAGSIVETDNVPGITGTITNLSTINDPKPVISGSGAEVGATITVVVGGQTMTTTVGAGGTWNVTPPIALTNGQTYTPVITATDAAGNTSAPVNGNTFTIDTVAPVSAGGLTHDAINDTGISTVDNITSNKSPSLSGTTEANAAIDVTVNGVHYLTTANAAGLWTVLLTGANLADGSYTPIIKATDVAGNTSTISGTPFIVDANPLAVADTANATEDVTLTVAASSGVLANDIVVAGDSKVVSAVGFGASVGTVGSGLTGTYGTLTLNADGSYTYLANTPAAEALAAGQVVTETFNYTMKDAGGSTSNTTLKFTVTGTNDAPTASPVLQTGIEDTPLILTWAAFGGADVDTALASLSVKITSLPADGTLTLNGVAVTLNQIISESSIAAGKLVFTPTANASSYSSGAAGFGNLHKDYTNFDFQITDGSLNSGTSNLKIDITPVADVPSMVVQGQLFGLIDNPNTSAVTANTTSGLTQATLEDRLGIASGTLDTLFNPPGTSPGNVDVFDGGAAANYVRYLTSGSQASFNWQFFNGEDTLSEINTGYNDLVVLVVTDALGNKQYIQLTSSEQTGPNTNGVAVDASGTYTYTAASAGEYTFSWLVLNAKDGNKDSNIAVSAPTITGSAYGPPIEFPIYAQLADTDGSESLSVTVSGLPAGAAFNHGTVTAGVWTFTATDLSGLELLPSVGFTGTYTLNVIATATEIGNNTVASTNAQTVVVTVDQTTNDMFGTTAADTLTGTTANDNIMGFSGNDTISGGNGNDLLDGGLGNDILNGGAGNDIIIGGQGNDTLTGGTGVDTFKWNLNDQATNATVATAGRDTITDFNTGTIASGNGDVLNLKDLLVGEANNGNSLDGYLHVVFNSTTNSTIIQINTAGAFTHGHAAETITGAANFSSAFADVSGVVNQQIVLTGVNLTTLGTSDAQIINNLIAQQKLITD